MFCDFLILFGAAETQNTLSMFPALQPELKTVRTAVKTDRDSSKDGQSIFSFMEEIKETIIR